MTEAPLVICSKSRWWPPLRREHAVARQAAAAGHEVHFIELPRHIKEGAPNLRSWSKELARPVAHEVEPGISILSFSTVLPGHLGRLALRTDGALLSRAISRVVGPRSIIVGSTPWQWPAIAKSRAARRIFDCTDDWGRIWGTNRTAFTGLYTRIAAEADQILLVSSDLESLFPGGRTAVVPNATDARLVEAPQQTPESPRSIAYVGTLTERFDAALMADVLDQLPDWSLDLYGECRYAGLGSEPAQELSLMLSRHPERARWHGPVPREQIAPIMDAAAVLVLPHRIAHSSGQDSMKLYDYAARGKPIVSTKVPSVAASGCPGILFADDAAGFAHKVEAATLDGPGVRASRRAWAAENTWTTRWPAWRDLALRT